MSTDHQQYSTENQSALIRRYAEAHDMEVVRTYADSGKSGLNINKRAALAALIGAVVSGSASFRAVLVYDVSRWGRFQDVDESAHYEFICRCAGIRVVYCAEQFANDGTPFDSLLKALKRAMAGEYSRELSAKVFAGQTRLVRLGYRQGGFAGHGLRRQVLEDGKTPGQLLKYGQRKGLQTDRTVLVPGPPEEIAVIHRIYRDFIYLRMNAREIANALNAEGFVDYLERPWTRHKVDTVLSNEKYIGNNIYHQLSSKLRTKPVKNRPADWVRCDGAFQPVLPVHLFEAAKKIREYRGKHLTDDQIFERLRALLKREGMLTGDLIDAQANLPSSGTIKLRLGGLSRVYEKLGYSPNKRYRFHDTNRALKAIKAAYQQSLLEAIGGAGIPVRLAQSGLFTFGDKWTLEVVISRCQVRRRRPTWRFNFERNLRADFAMVLRMETSNIKVRDFLLLPLSKIEQLPIYVDEFSEHLVNPYSFAAMRGVIAGITRMCRVPRIG
jgi:DNA invertase Pin-like site-specific DNA recombinase